MKIKLLLKETFKGGERKGKEKLSQLCTNMQESHLAYLQFLSRLIFLSKREYPTSMNEMLCQHLRFL